MNLSTEMLLNMFPLVCLGVVLLLLVFQVGEQIYETKKELQRRRQNKHQSGTANPAKEEKEYGKRK